VSSSIPVVGWNFTRGTRYNSSIDPVNGTPMNWTGAVTYPISNVKNGTSNPGWHDKIAKGLEASTYYKRTELKPLSSVVMYVHTESDGSPQWGTTQLKWDAQFSGCGFSNPVFTGQNNQATDDQALARMKSKIVEASGHVNVLTPIGELKDMRELIHTSAYLTTNFLADLIRAKKTHGRSITKYVSKAYLNWVFGLKPLISDIGQISNSIDQYLNQSIRRFRVVASAATDGRFVPATGGWPWSNTPSGVTTVVKGEGSYLLSYKYVGGINFPIYAANDYTMLTQLSIKEGMPALVPTAWELIPFSWMADYFGTVGQFLEDEFNSPPGTTSFLVKCRRYRANIRFTYDVSSVSPGYKASWTTGQNDVSYWEFERTVLSALPKRALRFRTFDEIGKGGISKLLNLIALAI